MAHFGSSLFLGLVVVVLASPASAEKVKPKTAREKAAQKACALGDYQKGVDILADLFVETDDPNLVFNQGRCYQQNSRYEQAIARFQEYLRKDDNLSENDKADAERRIRECEASLAKAAKAAQAAQPPAAAPAPVAPAETPATAPAPATLTPDVSTKPSPVAQQANPQPAGQSGSGFRTAGIVTAAVGGAALVASVVMNLKVNGMASDLQKTNGYDAGKVSDRNTYETLGWVGYGVGAACVATGAVLYYLGIRSGASESASVAFVPAFAPGQAGAVLKGAF
jgi:tetratricopeptide (TPR) repeat protein